MAACTTPFRLGNLVLRNNHLLSPLEGVSCVGFRSLCFKNGASLTFTEMVRAQGIIKNNQATLDLIDTFDGATPTGLQLLTKSASELQRALQALSRLSVESKWKHINNICAIDINLGCPSPSIIREGAGPSLLKRRKVLHEIFETLSNFKQSKENFGVQAVGCKIRLGLNSVEENHKIYLSVVEAATDCGLDWITVHARNARMRSSDLPHWDAIKEVVDKVNIRNRDGMKADTNVSTSQLIVIGNGDIKCNKSRNELHKLSQCDGFMIARAAIQNPWIFQSFLNDPNSIDTVYRPTVEEVEAAVEQYDVMSSLYATKPKFVAFHKLNFTRLMKAAKSRDFSASFRSPNTIHL